MTGSSRLSAADVQLLDAAHVAPGTRLQFPPLVVRGGSGALLEDQDGRTLIDFHSMACITNTGQSHPRVVEAIRRQAGELLHCNSGYVLHEPMARLAADVCGITPGSGDKKVAFGLSGSDANDGALKLARAATGRPKAVAFFGAYHGNTYGALSLSAVSLAMRRGFGPVVPEIHHIPYPDTYRGRPGVHPQDVTMSCLDAFAELLRTVAPPSEVAAVFLEPIQGDSGVLVPPPDFIRGLQRLCREHGILIVAEEVQTGLGRTGRWFASEHLELEPDVVVIGKAFASGMPLSAIVARADLMDAWTAPGHVFSTAANPVCCAAALATLAVIEEEGLLENARQMGTRLSVGLHQLAAELECIGDIRGRGLMLGVDLVVDRASKQRARALTAKTVWRCHELGLYLTFLSGSVLRLIPPLVITGPQVDAALEILSTALRDALAGRVSDGDVAAVVGW